MKYNVKIRAEKRKDKEGNIITSNVPLFADVTFSSTRMFYFTGHRIDADRFNPDSEEVRKNSTGREGVKLVQYNEINNRLRDIKASLHLFFQNRNEATNEQIVTLLDTVCNKAKKDNQAQLDVNNFFSVFEYYVKDIPISDVRKRNIKSTINHWRQYEKAKGIKITFQNITAELLRDFERYLKTGCTTPKGVNTIHKVMAMTRAFLNFAINELKDKGVKVNYPFGKDGYQIPGEVYGTPIYITKAERDMLFNLRIDNLRLCAIRDIFVFHCFVGCRVGDLKTLTNANISNNVLTYIPAKTKDESPAPVRIPLHPQALEILSRYNLPDGRLLPFIADQNYNDYIKELFELAGLTRTVTRLNPTTGTPEQVRLCDIASSHIARKTFVGNLYGKVDNDIIGSMSGHVPGSKAFARYHDVSEQLQQDAINLL